LAQGWLAGVVVALADTGAMFPSASSGAGGGNANPWAWSDPRAGGAPGAADWTAPAGAPKDKEAPAAGSAAAAAAVAAAAGSAQAAGAPPSSASLQGNLFQWLLAQVGLLIDTQIKRAKVEAEQNFKLEMGKLRKELQSVQVFTEQQGKVISALSKDLGGVSQDMYKLNQQLTGMQAQILQHRQVASATQVALDRGIKQLVDMDKRLVSVGAPPSSGMMRAFVGGLSQAAEIQEQHMAMVQSMQGAGAARTRTRKGKKEGVPRSLRAEAPEFVPGGGVEAEIPTAAEGSEEAE